MRLPVYAFFVVFAVVFACACSPLKVEGQQATTKPTALRENNPEDVQAIKAVIDSVWEALHKQDLERFKQYCSKDWMLYTARGHKFSANKLFDMHKANVEGFQLISSQLKIRIVGNMGWATYDARMSGQVKGKPWGGSFIFTNIFQKEDGRWVCLHMHESKREKEQ